MLVGVSVGVVVGVTVFVGVGVVVTLGVTVLVGVVVVVTLGVTVLVGVSVGVVVGVVVVVTLGVTVLVGVGVGVNPLHLCTSIESPVENNPIIDDKSFKLESNDDTCIAKVNPTFSL